MKAPAWSRLLYRLSRSLNALDLGQQILRDELLFAFVRPGYRNALTFDAYALSRVYLEGGDHFVDGLFDWEVALLEDSRIPRSGRVLLGAAGGGRELHGLLERGYEVYAFEPVGPLFESAARVARDKNALAIQATYQDLVSRAAGVPGPLDDLGGHFDLCILGWGSLSHLTEPSAVLETFRAVRKLAPQAPVMISFLLRSESTPPAKGGARKLRRTLRNAFAATGGLPVPAGLKFGTAYGFFYEFSRGELNELCAQAGYEIVHFSPLPHPHALLLPSAIAGAG